MRPEYFQVRTQTGVVHVFERHSIIRVEVHGFPGLLTRQDVPNTRILDDSRVNPIDVQIVIACYAAGYVELTREAAMSFLRQFYAGAHITNEGPEQTQGVPA